jgi:ATP-binding cassette subfamily B protein
MDDFTTFVDATPAVQRAHATSDAPASFNAIAAHGVSFTYPSRSEPSLSDVSVRIERGQIVALVGENGSGKTTLAKVLAGLYAPTAGSVCWDDIDIQTCDPEQVRSRIAVIFQDFVRYFLSAAENIGVGRQQRSDDIDAIVAAARRAGADSYLGTLAQGYQTKLGPQFLGGVDLSVGQWQRVALARAFFRDAPFIILDEPTAALDARAEYELFESIRTLAAGRTVLLISHRFSSVRSADCIYVLDRGHVVERGTHGELMARQGLYADLFTLQANAYIETEVPPPTVAARW